MPVTECETCNGRYWWRWEEAFDKFGFNDGDGQVMTEAVADVLRSAGYVVCVFDTGSHNKVIIEIAKKSRQLISLHVKRGYDKPREYLPAEVVALLDEKLPEDDEVTL